MFKDSKNVRLFVIWIVLIIVLGGIIVFIVNPKREEVKLPDTQTILFGRPWGPEQIIGEPNTPVAGDYTTAWASLTQDEMDEWIVLGFAKPIFVKKIIIHETFNAGAIYKITTLDNQNPLRADESVLWEGKAVVAENKDEIKINIIELKEKVELQAIKIYIASTIVPGWNEIDAVGLLDTAGIIHWAVYAETSSTYAHNYAGLEKPVFDFSILQVSHGKVWGPEQATGKPDSPPYAGDFVTAWASITEDEQDEWLTLTYEKPIQAKEIIVHETYNPGALYKITNFIGNEEVVIWQGSDPVTISRGGGGVSSIILDDLITLDKIRLYFQSTKVAGWNEIDAVQVKDVNGDTYWAIGAEASSSFSELVP